MASNSTFKVVFEHPTVGPPHSCYNAQTNEEFQQLLKWEEQCLVQLQENEILRPDMSKEDGTFELSFLCSVLRKFRTHTNMPSPGDNQGQAANMAGSKK